MSDNEGTAKKSGYRLEYASSARAKCKGAKPCAGTQIEKGALRVGSIVDFRGNTSFAWRHWGCTTTRIITNMKAKFSNPEDLDGFEDLRDEDQARIRHAWEEGHVADEDIPPTARKPAGDEEEEKPKKKRAPAKKKAETDGDEEEKPKRKRATKPKKTEEEFEDEDDAEEKIKSVPEKKARAKKPEGGKDAEKQKGVTRRQAGAPASRKALAPKKKVAKDDSEISEDFAEEMAELNDEEDEEADESAGKKRKRPASTKSAAATTKKPRATSSRAKKSKAVVEEDEDDE